MDVGCPLCLERCAAARAHAAKPLQGEKVSKDMDQHSVNRSVPARKPEAGKQKWAQVSHRPRLFCPTASHRFVPMQHPRHPSCPSPWARGERRLPPPRWCTIDAWLPRELDASADSCLAVNNRRGPFGEHTTSRSTPEPSTTTNWERCWRRLQAAAVLPEHIAVRAPQRHPGLARRGDDLSARLTHSAEAWNRRGGRGGEPAPPTVLRTRRTRIS